MDPFSWSWLLSALGEGLVGTGVSAGAARLRRGWQTRVWNGIRKVSRLTPALTKRSYLAWLSHQETWRLLVHPSETGAEHLAKTVLALSPPTTDESPVERLEQAREVVAATWIGLLRELPEEGWREVQSAILEDLKAGQAEIYGRLLELLEANQSVLHVPALVASTATRMVFSSQAIPYVARPALTSALAGFVDREERLLWTMMLGAGGSGKSRTALEFGLALPSDWEFGFLSESASEGAIDSWSIKTNTLVVVDYASRRAAEARRLVDQSLERVADGPKLRVLLLERRRTDDLDRLFIGGGSRQYRVEAIEHPSLSVSGFDRDDAWSLVQSVAANSVSDEQRGPLLDDLERLDPQLRPLTSRASR